MQTVTPRDLAARMAAGERFFLLDVREHDERDAGHIPDHLHIPMGAIPLRAHEIPAGAPVVVYCKGGGRSLRVAQFLASAGRTDLINLEGGATRWAAEVGPLVRC